MNDTAIKAYASIWDALADTPQEAAKLKVRSELMNQMSAFIKERGWTQVEAARRFSIPGGHHRH